MFCIYCGAKTTVLNSRPQKRPNNIWRRRQCTICTAVFTTSEQPDLWRSIIVKDNKALQPFSRDFLFVSIHDSLKHRKTATNDATALTATVIGLLSPTVQSGSVEKSDIYKITAQVLGRFDKSAQTYYQAFHNKDQSPESIVRSSNL